MKFCLKYEKTGFARLKDKSSHIWVSQFGKATSLALGGLYVDDDASSSSLILFLAPGYFASHNRSSNARSAYVFAPEAVCEEVKLLLLFFTWR
jgi:hypothetical protein